VKFRHKIPSGLPFMSNTPNYSWFVWGTWRFDSIRTESIRTTGSQDPWNNDTWTFDSIRTESIRITRSQDPWNNDTWTLLVLETWLQTWVDSCEVLNDSTRFARSRSAPPEVKTRELMIHERSSFLKRDYKPGSIRVRYLSSPIFFITGLFG